MIKSKVTESMSIRGDSSAAVLGVEPEGGQGGVDV